MRTILRRLFRKLKHLSLNKQDAELLFWTYELKSYQQWYDGEVSILHNTKNPNLSEKIDAPNQKDASILTWHKLQKEKKYLIDLDLDVDIFYGISICPIIVTLYYIGEKEALIYSYPISSLLALFFYRRVRR